MSSLPRDKKGNTVPALVPDTVQNKAFNGTSAQSAAFAARTTFAEFSADQKCWLLFGANPSATVGTGAPGLSIPLAANQKVVYGVTAGQKVAVIRDSADGTLTIVEGL